MSRVRVAALLVAPLLMCVGCQDTDQPADDPGKRLDQLESTLADVEGDLAGD